MSRNNVHQRFRRPETLETKETYARRTRNQKRSKTFPCKRLSVHKAYNKVREVAAEFNVPCVKKTFGTKIVRVCCRTNEQLDNIGSILKDFMKVHFIMEIGMPLEYCYKMKSLILFIKPKDNKLSSSIEHVLQESNFGYSYFNVKAIHPSVAAERLLTEMETNNSVQEGENITTIPQNGTNMCIWDSAEERNREIEHLKTIVLILTIGIILLLVYIIFDI